MALPTKERLSEYHGENISLVDVETPPKVESKSEHVEEVNKGVSLSSPVLDDTGQVIMDDAVSKGKMVISLPLTEEEMKRALHLRVIYSLRWLAEWTKRLLKMIGGRFDYRSKIEERSL